MTACWEYGRMLYLFFFSLEVCARCFVSFLYYFIWRHFTPICDAIYAFVVALKDVRCRLHWSWCQKTGTSPPHPPVPTHAPFCISAGRASVHPRPGCVCLFERERDLGVVAAEKTLSLCDWPKYERYSSDYHAWQWPGTRWLRAFVQPFAEGRPPGRWEMLSIGHHNSMCMDEVRLAVGLLCLRPACLNACMLYGDNWRENTHTPGLCLLLSQTVSLSSRIFKECL